MTDAIFGSTPLRAGKTLHGAIIKAACWKDGETLVIINAGL
jgi:hypothetical protein